MAFTLHGSSEFTCTRRVALIAKERNVPYRLITVDVKGGEHKQPAHLKHQPFGQVPYIIQEDGFELFESRAIGRYIATLGSGPELIPTEPKAHAKFEQAAGIEYAQFDPVANGIVKEKIYKPFFEVATDETKVQELTAQLESKLDGYETLLSKQKYLAGNEVTLADLFHLPYGSIVFEELGYGSLDKRLNVKRWWKDISSRPAWQAVKEGA
ncbi:glutathione S-transferase-like protein [Russula ochroleuca]|jgi:glutathione S-transferase|uniref:glutathione transferase n=1 Tax=Russula ochroleuca TaxID=152965 RepID=A0A9P5JYY1_9AGAM|nr:glutathione S-transferase-like protein [Russula ochroleuca]